MSQRSRHSAGCCSCQGCIFCEGMHPAELRQAQILVTFDGFADAYSSHPTQGTPCCCCDPYLNGTYTLDAMGGAADWFANRHTNPLGFEQEVYHVCGWEYTGGPISACMLGIFTPYIDLLRASVWKLGRGWQRFGAPVDPDGPCPTIFPDADFEQGWCVQVDIHIAYVARFMFAQYVETVDQLRCADFPMSLPISCARPPTQGILLGNSCSEGSCSIDLVFPEDP